MSQDRLIDAVSLSTVCEPDVFDCKDCLEPGLQILGALRDTSSGTLRDTTQQLFCSKQITRLSTPFSSRCVSDRYSFFWHLPASGSSTWIECLNSYLWIIQLDAEPAQTQQNFIRSFPRFFVLSLGRHIWTNDHMANDCSRFTFLVMLDIASYHSLTKIVPIINWLPAFLTRQSRERWRPLYDVPQNIRPTDSIEWHWSRGCGGVGSIPRQSPESIGTLSITTILTCVAPN
jgi:hypothetical protein